MKRGYLQISFSWLFSIIAGAFILFLAIYITTQLISNEQTTQDFKTGKEIGVLFNPLETGFDDAVSTLMTLPAETRISTNCEGGGNFGKQIISISQKSLGKWTKGAEVKFENKYIFSENPEGKNFYVFSKPFDFPFKVGDLIYLTSEGKNYCFLDAPEAINEELTSLKKQKNLFLENCPSDSVKICFGASSDCDINVDYNRKYVEKVGRKVYFNDDATMYAAIFSSAENYECQIKRIMKRVSVLASLYQQKANFVENRECFSYLNLDLLKNAAENLASSSGLKAVKNIAEEIELKNNIADCRLW